MKDYIIARILFLMAALHLLFLNSCKKNEDELSPPEETACEIHAGFIYAVDSINERIIFTNQSSGDVSEYEWNFGDNSASSDPNPVHTYSSPGEVQVCLTVKNPADGCNQRHCININVPVSAVPVESKNRALLIDFSETWCPPCGAYGGPGFDSCLVLEGAKISALRVYGSSSPASLNSPFASEFISDFNIAGYPTFYLNSQPMNASGGVYSSAGANYNWANAYANSFASQSVKAGLIFSRMKSGNMLTVETKCKFFSSQPSGKDFRIAVYLVEDQVIAPQEVSGKGTVTDYVHRNLIRACNSAVSYKGIQLNSSGASVATGQIFKNSFNMALNPGWNYANLKVVAVLWEVPSTGKPAVINTITLN